MGDRPNLLHPFQPGSLGGWRNNTLVLQHKPSSWDPLPTWGSVLPKSRALGTGREVEASRQPPRGSLLRRAGTKPQLRYFSPADPSRAGGEETPKGAEPRPPGTQDAGAEAAEAAGRPAPEHCPAAGRGALRVPRRPRVAGVPRGAGRLTRRSWLISS